MRTFSDHLNCDSFGNERCQNCHFMYSTVRLVLSAAPIFSEVRNLHPIGIKKLFSHSLSVCVHCLASCRHYLVQLTIDLGYFE